MQQRWPSRLWVVRHGQSAGNVDLRVVVALKGARTFFASPLDHPSVCREGNVGLATAGSGDVLAGVITGFSDREHLLS